MANGEYSGPERRGGGRWANGITISHLITTGVVMIGGITYVSDIKESVAISENKIESLAQRMDRSDTTNDKMFQDIKRMIERVETKIDKMADWRRFSDRRERG